MGHDSFSEGGRPLSPSSPVLGELLSLSFKMCLAQLAPLVASLYLARLVAGLGALAFSSYSLVTAFNMTMFVAASGFLQSLYFVGGRAKGSQDVSSYHASILAGLGWALGIGALLIALSCGLGEALSALRFDPEVVQHARSLGRAAALGIAPSLLLLVYRVHASLHDRAGLVTLVHGIGALAASLLATIAVTHAVRSQSARWVLLSVAGANWLMLLVALASLRTSPGLWPGVRTLKAAGGKLRSNAALVASVGWPIGAVVLLDSAASMVSSLIVGRYWLAAVPVHSVALLWVAMGLIVPLGISQAVVQRVAVLSAQKKSGARNRVAWISLTLAALFGVLVVALFAAAPVQMGALLLGASAFEAAPQQLLRSLMPLAAALLALQSIIVVAAASLRGIGQTRAPLIQALVGYCILATGGQLLFGRALRFGVTGVWWGLLLGFGITAIAVTARCFSEFRSRADLAVPSRAQGGTPGERISEEM